MDPNGRRPDGEAGADELRGFEVFTADDDKLGTVGGILDGHPPTGDTLDGQVLRVEPGLIQKLFGAEEELLVSETMIDSIHSDDGEVILNVTRDHLEDGG